MKHIRDKDKIKSKSKHWKSRFVHEGEEVGRINLVEPSKPRSKVKASVTDMKLSNVSEELITGGKAPKLSKKTKAVSNPSKPVLNRKQKKAANKKAAALANGGKGEPTVKDERARATVHKIDKKKKLHSVTSKDEASVIEKLDAHIVKHEQVKASDEERTLVDQPKPHKVDSVKQAEVPTTVVEAVTEPVRSEVKVVDKQVWVKGGAGSVIRNTGDGMTPSGKPITEFVSGGRFAPTGTMRTDCWDAEYEYTYEELGVNYDALKLAFQQQADSYQKRIDSLNEQVSELSQAHSIRGFNAAHTSKGEGVVPKGFDEQQDMIIDLQTELVNRDTENSYLSKSNEDLSKEVTQLSDLVEQLEHHARGGVEEVSVNSKPPIKTLGQYFNLYSKDYRDNPIRSFLKNLGYSLKLEKPLRQHFNVVAQARADEAARRMAVVSPEVMGIRRIARAVKYKLRCEKPTGFCSKLHSVTSLPAKYTINIGILSGKQYTISEAFPLAYSPPKEEYCKVWEDFDIAAFHKQLELKAQLSTKTHRYIVNPLCNVIKSTKDFLNYELSSSTRKATDEKIKEAEVNASKVKELIEKEFAADDARYDLLERAREAYRIAH